MKHFYTRRGENKSSKKAPLFLLPFCVRRARDFLLLFRGKAALVFFSLSCLSLHPRSSRVFFKKSGRKSICWLFFFTREIKSVFHHKTTLKTTSYISLYIHLRTTNTITTHIIHHSRRRANANASVCCCCCCCFISLARAVVV